MTDTLMLSGEAELFKCLVHLSVFGLTAMCLGYNVMAFSQRRQRHLAINACAYLGFACFEARQIQCHWRDT